MHFETIWNMAESLSKSYTDLDRKEILRLCRNSMDDLVDGTDQNELNEAMGNILFGLCAFCAYCEKKGIIINSATSLSNIIEKKREEILDPLPTKDDSDT